MLYFFIAFLINFLHAEAQLVLSYLENVNSNVDVSCGFQDNIGPTLWIINGSIYDLRKESHPFILLDGIYTIRIPEVNLCLNDTTFQCLSSNRHPEGKVTQILVEPCKCVCSISFFVALMCTYSIKNGSTSVTFQN